VARFQGGPNAGHTLTFDGIKHVLHQVPSGIFHPHILNIVGNGVVLDPIVFRAELQKLTDRGVDWAQNLYISKKAQLILPSHRALDRINEEARGGSKIGSTLKGIGLRVQAWAWLGYGFIVLLLLGTVASMVGILSLLVFTTAFALILKVGAALGYFAWKIIRSLWVRFDEPTGRLLTPTEAAPLFALLAQQAHDMQAPAVHRVLLTSEFNAAIVQLPRLGVLGWPRNYLMVGLPLLQAMTADQAAAVVAHELGHLRGGHGRCGAGVYRVSQSWAQLLAQLERNDSGTWLRRFTNWYVPQFNAWSHPLRRTAEFEADAAAGRATSPRRY
jgi:Zn-dependent protease with chaperone function